MVKISLARTLATRSESELIDLHDRWVGGSPPPRRADLVQVLRDRMVDPATVSDLCAGLYGALAPVFRVLAKGPGKGLALDKLSTKTAKEGIASRSLRPALADLVQTGLIAQVMAGRNGNAHPVWGIPEELGEVLPTAGAPEMVQSSPLSLRGWLTEFYQRKMPAAAGGEAVRKMYTLLAGEAAVMSRVQSLEEDVRALVENLAMRYGGILPAGDFDELVTNLKLEKVVKALEKNSLGTMLELNLEPSGIRQNGRVLCLFQEVVVAILKNGSLHGEPAQDAIASIGIDFVSNFSRFASFVEGDTVRFTVRGSIYKSTGKRIAEQLLPNPGREFRRFEILELEYRFALACHLIDRTGERSFRLTPTGQDFLNMTLLEKQRLMLDWFVEDRELPGDLSHQLRLRRTTLRYIKRLEPNTWYDAMFLPFVARNHHLADLTAQEQNVADKNSFPVRSSADVQSLSWNLFVWMRKYLYLLGIIDMAYESSGRAVAVRLTRVGAELLDVIPGREIEGSGHVVVNPDFEVVLFPDRRSHDLVYRLDRFCDREFTDSLYHYRITPASLHRALSEGMTLDEIFDLLQDRSRTPLPQNVSYSLESWARKGGLVTFRENGRLECEQKEVLDRITLHPELRGIGFERVDDETVQLHGEVPVEDLSSWIRDYGASLRVA
ncbi:MAG: helicase-associated domain-containing protein [Planctomycetota bacterium]